MMVAFIVFLVSCDCKCSVALPQARVPRVGLRCVIVFIPGHTHLLFRPLKITTKCPDQCYDLEVKA